MGARGFQPFPAEVRDLRGTAEPWLERKYKGRDTTPSPYGDAAEPELLDRDYLGMAEAYCTDVLDGTVTCCQWTKKAVQRFQAMRAKAEADDGGYVFSREAVQDVCDFAEHCPHIEGKWASDCLTLEPFQAFLFAACYGFRVKATGGRLVTVVFFQVARKSAKSTLVAVAGLYHLAKEQEPGAQVVCGASTGNQARIVFGIMQKMVRRSAWLRGFGLQVFANAVTLEAIGANARPINSKSSTQDGLNPSFISLDESHAQTFELRDVLISAMGARDNGTIWCPTTAGYDLTSVGYALRTTAQKILDGVLESDHTFVVLYEFEEGDDWRDERVWQKAAPMLGVTPKLAYVRNYCADCQQTPGMQGEFETKIGCRWLHSASRWLSIDQWDKCADSTLTLESFLHQKCWIGGDLAERDDIAAISLNFRKDGTIYSFVKGFLPKDVIIERMRAVPEYRTWLQSGELEGTDGPITDYGRVEAYIRDCCQRFDVQEIVLERYGALHLASNLLDTGLPAIVESKNVKVFTPPMTELEARMKSLQFRHQGLSFLRWHASNACREKRRDGSMLTTKDGRDSPHKIDGIDAMLLGWHSLLRSKTTEPSYGMFFIGGAR